jgi:hypothetical protein
MAPFFNPDDRFSWESPESLGWIRRTISAVRADLHKTPKPQ